MAGEKDEQDVILEEEGTITIDISDSPELAAKEQDEQDEGKAPEKEKKPAQPRVRLNEQKPAEEAAKALSEAKAEAEANAAKARGAEATAAAERQRREAAERAAAAARQEAEDARASAENTQLTLVENGIEAAKTEVESLEAQIATAYEGGDFKLVASLQSKQGKANARLDRLEAQKEALESAPKKTPTTEGRVESPTGQSLQEQYLAQFGPEAQSWLRSHPECIPAQYGGNASANAKMMKGHYDALAQNVTPNTPDYFRIIEEHTGHRQPTSKAAEVVEAGTDQDDEAEQPAPKPKRAAQPAAPPSREPPRSNGQQPRSRTVTLTKDQQDMAKLSFPNLKPAEAFAQYARNLLELEAEGKMGRLTH